MKYPTIVGIDLDNTFWVGCLDQNNLGSHGWIGDTPEDNLVIHQNRIIADVGSNSRQVTASDDIFDIIHDLLLNHVRVAIVSRNDNKALCDRALWLLSITDPYTGQRKPFTAYIKYDEIMDSVTFQKVQKPSVGLSWDDYQQGLYVWRCNDYIRRNTSNIGLDPLPNRRCVGYVGTDSDTAKLYKSGERRRPSGRPSRWGWGMYVTDDPKIAEEFATWRRERDAPENHWFCPVFVRDYEIFQWIRKVWVKEGSIEQTDVDKPDQEIAQEQIDRDNKIERIFGIKKPYILFSKHVDMSGTGRRRFNEMVVYPQLQDALFYGQPVLLRDAPLLNRPHLNYQEKIAEWNITTNDESRHELGGRRGGTVIETERHIHIRIAR
ncbi:acid phosphatase-domain-containing protein [Hypoxylon trugodes]|uniref:acid phosphatase-domain-containing protein n=1 Tax=Hypoxylon trugodes TaxID=326681 RepID=UPI0021921953|nr:acid phosphatase-domain-containing protein [Hypoxylon trugodes]KAI1386602.1 acid phosphatase-domain-containing protein [Hypoxylon trugodes]